MLLASADSTGIEVINPPSTLKDGGTKKARNLKKMTKQRKRSVRVQSQIKKGLGNKKSSTTET